MTDKSGEVAQSRDVIDYAKIIADEMGDALGASRALFASITKPASKARREEITKILESQASTALTLKEKNEIGGWLNQRFDRLKDRTPGGDGIDRSDVVEAYSSGKLNDKTRFLWSDMRMLKRVASHFNEIALGGLHADLVEKEDVEGLKRGASVKRTDHDVTTTFPDGEMNRRTSRGELLRKGSDGSLSFEATNAKMELKADGTGSLKIQIPQGQFQLSNAVEIQLQRGKNGIWIGKLHDEELQLAIDDHSVHIQSDSLDVLFTSTGGYMREPSDPDSTVFINADGSLSMTENGKAATIGVNRDNGILMALDSEGGREVQYAPIETRYWNDGKGKAGIVSEKLFPSMEASPDGTLKIFIKGSEPIVATPDSEGNARHTFPNGLVISHDKDGTFKLQRPVDVDEFVTVGITASGAFFIEAMGERHEMHPPELRKPPAINK